MTEKKILLVEDEAITALGIQSFLVRRGYQVPKVAASGEEAIRDALDLKPDLILMDIRLHGEMSGITAAGRIRKCLDVPVVFLTAHSDVEILKEAKKTEPYGYLLKPCNLETLLTTIEMALHKAKVDNKRNRVHQEKEKLVSALEGDLARAKLLDGLLPICTSCKSVRDDQGHWQDIEAYLRRHSEAEFAHGLCPGCMAQRYPDFKVK